MQSIIIIFAIAIDRQKTAHISGIMFIYKVAWKSSNTWDEKVPKVEHSTERMQDTRHGFGPFAKTLSFKKLCHYRIVLLEYQALDFFHISSFSFGRSHTPETTIILNQRPFQKIPRSLKGNCRVDVCQVERSSFVPLTKAKIQYSM